MEIISSKEVRKTLEQFNPKIVRSVYAKLEKLSVTGKLAGATKRIYKDIWEVKINNVRILYRKLNGKIELLKAFVKSTCKTPKEILRFAQSIEMGCV